MRFHNTNKLIFSHSLLVLVLWSGGTVRAPGHKTGKLVGNMIFVDSGENLTLGDAANTTVELAYKNQIILLVSGDHGDYIRELQEGTYCLRSAKDSQGRPVCFSPSQHRCFKIKNKQSTRFDVMLLKP